MATNPEAGTTRPAADASSPIGMIAELLRVDPVTARLILAALGIVAAVSIAKTFGFSPEASGLMVVYILGMGVAGIMLARVVSDPRMSWVLGWFTTILVMVVVIAFAVSAFTRSSALLQPTYCLVQFWRGCPAVEHEIARTATQNVRAPVSIPAPAQQQVASAPISRPRVFIQFGGLIDEASIARVTQALLRGGWNVQGRGERVGNATGLHEVRYAPANEAAAKALADALTLTGLTSEPIELNPRADAKDNLEVWVYR